jgi:hypothetical protein
MIYFVLAMKTFQMIASRHPHRVLSFEKVCGWIAESMLRVTKLELPPLGDIRHVIADRRKRPRLSDLARSLSRIRGLGSCGSSLFFSIFANCTWESIVC